MARPILSVQDYKNLLRWADAIAARPAVKRGRIVNKSNGDLASQLHERHDASDFDSKRRTSPRRKRPPPERLSASRIAAGC